MTEIFCQSWSIIIGVWTGTLDPQGDTGQKYALMAALLCLNLAQVIFILFCSKPCNFDRVNTVMLASKSLDSWSSFVGFFSIAFPGSDLVAVMWLVGTLAWAVFTHCYMKKASLTGLLRDGVNQISEAGVVPEGFVPGPIDEALNDFLDEASVYDTLLGNSNDPAMENDSKDHAQQHAPENDTESGQSPQSGMDNVRSSYEEGMAWLTEQTATTPISPNATESNNNNTAATAQQSVTAAVENLMPTQMPRFW